LELAKNSNDGRVEDIEKTVLVNAKMVLTKKKKKKKRHLQYNSLNLLENHKWLLIY
jgi:hypothetical protein